MTADPGWEPIESAKGPREKQAADFMKEHWERVRYDPAALRCALGDAAHLLDAIRSDMRPIRPLRGELGRRAEAMAFALKRGADAIWALRDSVSVLPPPPSQEG